MNETILTVYDVAEYLRVRPSTIYRLLKQDKNFPGFRVGSDWRFTEASIDKWRLAHDRASRVASGNAERT